MVVALIDYVTRFSILCHLAKIGIATSTLPPAKQVGFQGELKYKPLASYIATIQAHQVNDVLEFAETEEEKRDISKVYDAVHHQSLSFISNLKERIVYHPEDDLSLYPFLLSHALCRFFENEHIRTFYVMPHIKRSLVGLEGDASLWLSQQWLMSIAGNRDYNEAYAVNQSSFEEMIQALFWIVRCDASISEYVFLQPDRTNYFMSLCKYGNLHFHLFRENELTLLNKLRYCGLIEWQGKEFDRFNNSNAIRKNNRTLAPKAPDSKGLQTHWHSSTG